MDQRREKEGVVILSHFDKIYGTHKLKLGMDQRKEKEGVVILSHFDMHICHRCELNSACDKMLIVCTATYVGIYGLLASQSCYHSMLVPC